MKTSKITQNQYYTTFQAKISPDFEKFMRSYINNGSNRIQNNYRLNKKLEDLKNFGYNNYTVSLITEHKSYGNEYKLVAIKDGSNTNKGIFLFKRNVVRSLIESFLNLRKGEFSRLIQKHSVYKK